MSQNSNGEVLGAATVLPATSAVTSLVIDKVHPTIIAGFVAVNLAGLLYLAAKITRYFINRK